MKKIIYHIMWYLISYLLYDISITWHIYHMIHYMISYHILLFNIELSIIGANLSDWDRAKELTGAWVYENIGSHGRVPIWPAKYQGWFLGTLNGQKYPKMAKMALPGRKQQKVSKIRPGTLIFLLELAKTSI